MIEIKTEPVSFLVYLKPQCTGWVTKSQSLKNLNAFKELEIKKSLQCNVEERRHGDSWRQRWREEVRRREGRYRGGRTAGHQAWSDLCFPFIGFKNTTKESSLTVFVCNIL